MKRILAVAVVAILAVVAMTSVSAGTSGTFGQRHGCSHLHRSSVAYKRINALLRTHYSVNKSRVNHYATCLATRAKAHHAHEVARAGWAWRHTYANRWPIVFNRLPSWDRSWAWSTGACESGNNPATNTGNGFYGAFQFVMSTWHSAGGTGSPTQHSWHYQAVIAVRWMHVAGAGQWPVCGR